MEEYKAYIEVFKYIGVSVIGGLVAWYVAIKSKLNNSKRDDNLTERDESTTELMKIQNDIAAEAIVALRADNISIREQIKILNEEKFSYASGIGKLSSENDTLKAEIVKVNDKLDTVLKELDLSRQDAREKESSVIKLTTELEITKANLEEALNKIKVLEERETDLRLAVESGVNIEWKRWKDSN